MYPQSVRDHAAALRRDGLTWSAISRQLGVSRAAIRAWDQADPLSNDCHVCGDRPVAGDAYAALLGFYLGDGGISKAARYYALRISCDARQLGIVGDVSRTIEAIRPNRKVFHVAAPGVVVVQSNWQHWPCLFPQHGPGRKHERPIVLEDWQRHIVEAHPGPFLRGLFHSDGCRVDNWARRPVAGELKTYRYGRWQFSNASADIRELCCWALDLVDVAWRQSAPRVISVSRRAAVARLDELIGPKS